MKYFYITDRYEDRFEPLVPKFTSIFRPGGCRACGFVPLGSPPKSPLAVRSPGRRPKAIFTGTVWGFLVAHVDLIEAFGPDVREHLLFGSLVVEDGRPLEAFKTIRAREQVLVRDGPHSVHRVCSVCGALRYTGWPGDDPYVMAWDLRSVAPVYEVEAVSLLIREDVRDRIGDRWSKAIGFVELPILDVPRDELPAQLDVVPTPEQLVGYRPNASTATTPATLSPEG